MLATYSKYWHVQRTEDRGEGGIAQLRILAFFCPYTSAHFTPYCIFCDTHVHTCNVEKPVLGPCLLWGSLVMQPVLKSPGMLSDQRSWRVVAQKFIFWTSKRSFGDVCPSVSELLNSSNCSKAISGCIGIGLDPTEKSNNYWGTKLSSYLTNIYHNFLQSSK